MNRRVVAIAAPLLAATVLGTASGAAFNAPEARDARLADFPEVAIQLTEDGIVAPERVAAGYTLLVEENRTAAPGHAFVLRVPDDVSEAELRETLGGEALVSEVPDWFWRAEFMGNGDGAAPDGAAIALADLQPGRYIVGDPYSPPAEFARFTVTGSGSTLTANAPIAADVQAELFEMGFTLPETVPAGQQIWQFRNTGAMLHEIAIFPAPVGATQADIETAVSAELAADMGGDPAKARATIDALGAEWVGWSAKPVAGISVLSPQRASWAQIGLEPGTYGAVCFVPEPNSGKAHLMLGMTAVFTAQADA